MTSGWLKEFAGEVLSRAEGISALDEMDRRYIPRWKSGINYLVILEQ